MFYKAQMFTNLEKFMLKFILLFIALAKQAAILPVVQSRKNSFPCTIATSGV
jgi:hypothetical protein